VVTLDVSSQLVKIVEANWDSLMQERGRPRKNQRGQRLFGDTRDTDRYLNYVESEQQRKENVLKLTIVVSVDGFPGKPNYQ
jgi:hypothetical protein